MTLPDTRAPLRRSIITCKLFYEFQKADRDCLFLGSGFEGCRAFSAAHLTGEMLSASKQVYPDSDPLYFKSGGALVLGDQDHPLTAFARHNNRVIAFGTAGAWSLQRADVGDAIEYYFLDSCPGCTVPDGVITVGEELLAITPAGLCSLRADSADKDHFAVKPIGPELSGALAGMDPAQTIFFFDAAKGRILMRDAGERDEGLLYLYDRALGLWTIWNHVPATAIFSSDRGILFANGSKLFRFDNTAFLDNGREYDAYYQSGPISFGSPEEYKRALRFFCEASGEGQQIALSILTESGSADQLLNCDFAVFPIHYECRVPTGRFRYFSYRISFLGAGPAALHRVGYCCNL